VRPALIHVLREQIEDLVGSLELSRAQFSVLVPIGVPLVTERMPPAVRGAQSAKVLRQDSRSWASCPGSCLSAEIGASCPGAGYYGVVVSSDFWLGVASGLLVAVIGGLIVWYLTRLLGCAPKPDLELVIEGHGGEMPPVNKGPEPVSLVRDFSYPS
jgi:hypothetical protein